MHASNTLFLEACLGWRGLLVEANPSSFAKLRLKRPGMLGIQAAACVEHRTVTFSARHSLGLFRARGITAVAPDETGGVVELMSPTFERAGYRKHAPSKWLRSARGLTFNVPCSPLRDQLALLAVKRVDVMWCDVEGAELTVLQSIGWDAVSVGVVVVEMRFNDASRNRLVYSEMYRHGFELLRTLKVWEDKIVDNVFLNPAHFGLGRSAALPARVLSFLTSQPRNVPYGANLKLLPGRVAGPPYVVAEPTTQGLCTVDVGGHKLRRILHTVLPNNRTVIC